MSSFHVLLFNSDEKYVNNDANALEKENEKIECKGFSNFERALENSDTVNIIVYCLKSEQKEIKQIQELKDKSEKPIVILSSETDEAVVADIVNIGVDGYALRNRGGFQKISEIIVEELENVEIHLNEEHLRQLYKQIPDSIFLKNSEGVYKAMNPSGADYFGLTPEEVKGKKTSELYADSAAKEIRKDDSEVMKTEEAISGTREWKIGDEEFNFTFTKLPHRNERGDIDGVFGTYRDVTDEKKESRRAEAIFNNSKDMMAILDKEGAVLKANKVAEDILNTSKEELKGKKLKEQTNFFSRQRCMQMFQETLGGNTVSETVEVEICGEKKIMEVTLTPIKSENNEVKSVLFKAYDFTELKKSQNRLKAAFNSSYDMMALLDSNGDVLRINNAVEDFFDIDREQIKGKNYRELQELIDKEDLMDLYHRFFKPSHFDKLLKENYFRNKVDLEREDGQTATLDIALNAMRNENGEITTILAEGRDITKPKIKERQLKDQKRRLERFSSIVSHDLRNPLNVASGYLELAEKTGDEEDFEKAMDAIERIDQIIKELLELSGKPEHFEKKELELENIFEEACSYVENNPDYEINGSLKFKGGRSGAIRMFENLIKNTKEHNNDAKIKVGTIEKGFYYEDDGYIDENIDKILEYGYPSSNEGSGLGLSIVQRVAEINEWNLNLTKNSNGGLRLEFLLKD